MSLGNRSNAVIQGSLMWAVVGTSQREHGVSPLIDEHDLRMRIWPHARTTDARLDLAIIVEKSTTPGA